MNKNEFCNFLRDQNKNKFNPLVSEASRDVANLTERKNMHTDVSVVSNLKSSLKSHLDGLCI